MVRIIELVQARCKRLEIQKQTEHCWRNVDKTKRWFFRVWGLGEEQCHGYCCLYNVIDKNLHGSIAYAEIASEIRNDLKERYSQGNEIRIHQLRREITLTAQGTLSMTDYVAKIKTLWDELSAHLMMPNCSCTKEYNLYKYQRQNVSINFLWGWILPNLVS